MKSRLTVLGAAVLLMAAACNNAEPTPDPTVAFCDSLKTLGTAVADFKKLDAQSTIEDIQTGAEAVKSDFDAFKTAAGNLANDQVKAIEDAVSELQTAVENVPDTDTVEQAVQSLVPQIEAVEAARAEAGSAQCGEVAVEAAASAAADAASAAADAADAAKASAGGGRQRCCRRGRRGQGQPGGGRGEHGPRGQPGRLTCDARRRRCRPTGSCRRRLVPGSMCRPDVWPEAGGVIVLSPAQASIYRRLTIGDDGPALVAPVQHPAGRHWSRAGAGRRYPCARQAGGSHRRRGRPHGLSPGGPGGPRARRHTGAGHGRARGQRADRWQRPCHEGGAEAGAGAWLRCGRRAGGPCDSRIAGLV